MNHSSSLSDEAEVSPSFFVFDISLPDIYSEKAAL